MRAVALALTVLALLAAGAGCAGTANEQPRLDGTSWRLTSWAEPDPLPSSVTITAEFTDGRVSGSAGVNRYNASVSSGVDGSFAVDAPITTKMAGPADATAAERAYLARLQAATSYRIDDDTLVIDDADGATSLTFARG